MIAHELNGPEFLGERLKRIDQYILRVKKVQVHTLDDVVKHGETEERRVRKNVCWRCHERSLIIWYSYKFTFFPHQMLYQNGLERSIRVVDGFCMNVDCRYDLWPWLCSEDNLRNPAAGPPQNMVQRVQCRACEHPTFQGLIRGGRFVHGLCTRPECGHCILPGRLGLDRFLILLKLQREKRRTMKLLQP